MTSRLISRVELGTTRYSTIGMAAVLTLAVDLEVRAPADDHTVRLNTLAGHLHLAGIARTAVHLYGERTLRNVTTAEFHRHLVHALRLRDVRHGERQLGVVVEANVGRCHRTVGRLNGHVHGAAAGRERFDGEVGGRIDNRTGRLDARTERTNSAHGGESKTFDISGHIR